MLNRSHTEHLNTCSHVLTYEFIELDFFSVISLVRHANGPPFFFSFFFNSIQTPAVLFALPL